MTADKHQYPRICWASVLLVICGLTGCCSQYQYGYPQRYQQQYPTYGGGAYYVRPFIYPPPPTYGYNYNTANMRTQTTDGYDEMVDNAQKAAMQPLNNVMASPADGVLPQELPPASLRSSSHQDDAGDPGQSNVRQTKRCQTTGCPKTDDWKTEVQDVAVTPSPATRQIGQGYKRNDLCTNCPCYKCPNFPPNSINEFDWVYKYKPKPPTKPYSYYSYSPQKEVYRSARTFWLPWLNGEPAVPQNPLAYTYHNPYMRPVYAY